MTEHEEQVALMRLVEMHKGRWPELGMLYAIPNGGKRSRITCAICDVMNREAGEGEEE